MKIFLASLLGSLAVFSGPTMRLDGENGYFIEATMMEDSKLIAKTSKSPACTGSYLKDMVAKRMIVVLDKECSNENLVIYFSDENYRMLYSGSDVEIEYNSSLYPNERKMGTAKIIRLN